MNFSIGTASVRCGLWLFCVLLCSPCLAAPDPAPQSEPSSAESILSSWATTIQGLYTQAKETGEEVPANAYEWAKGDLEAAGDWEYKVIRLASDSATETEAVLNRWGEDGWQCFWVQTQENGIVLFFKRQRVSQIRNLPFAEMLRLLPILGDGSTASE